MKTIYITEEWFFWQVFKCRFFESSGQMNPLCVCVCVCVYASSIFFYTAVCWALWGRKRSTVTQHLLSGLWLGQRKPGRLVTVKEVKNSIVWDMPQGHHFMLFLKLRSEHPGFSGVVLCGLLYSQQSLTLPFTYCCLLSILKIGWTLSYLWALVSVSVSLPQRRYSDPLDPK